MPSSPPSLFSVPLGAITLLDNGKHLFTLLSKIMMGSAAAAAAAKKEPDLPSSLPPSPSSDLEDLVGKEQQQAVKLVEALECTQKEKTEEEEQQPQPLKQSAELDIGLLGNDDELGDCTLEGALQLTAALVAQSVYPLLAQPGRARILVLGADAEWRASFLGEATFTERPVIPLAETLASDMTEEALLSARKRAPRNAVFWSDCDSSSLDLCPASLFDAVLVFNAPTASPVGPLARRLARVLRPGGCLAGTGLFAASTESQAQAPHVSLRSFRDAVEELGLFMHMTMDMSLEGRLVLRVADPDHDPLDGLRRGDLLCGRFLATKPSLLARAARPDRVVSVTGCADPGLLTSLPSPLAASSLSARLPLTAVPEEEGEHEAQGGETETEAGQRVQAADNEQPQPSSSESVVVTGISLGLPNAQHPDRALFDSRNIGSLFAGENFLSDLTVEEKQKMLDMNIVQITKKEGKRIERKISADKEVIQVASKIAHFDLAKEYGIAPVIVEAMDITYQLAVAAGLEALRDAGISLSASHGPSPHGRPAKPLSLPPDMQDDTGIIFASSFPALDSLVQEVTACTRDKVKREFLADLKELSASASSLSGLSEEEQEKETYRYNRKLLFRLLVMAHSQLAELINARGPNTQVNAACAGTTQAIALAEDWIRTGRCRRVVVVSADDPTNDTLFPYIGTGFLALTAATTIQGWQNAAAPFDKRRKGMILGAGACGIVLEASHAAIARAAPIRAELVASAMKNSALHASLMDQEHICHELATFVQRMEKEHGLARDALAKDLLYYSHETFTGVCAKIEVAALRSAFGDAGAADVLIANTKGFTGHPMAVGIEDVMAVASLSTGLVPPIANLREADPALGPLTLSRGGRHSRSFVLRFAAGFGSQFVILLFKKWQHQQQQQQMEQA